jgi:hypothetical protein
MGISVHCEWPFLIIFYLRGCKSLLRVNVHCFVCEIDLEHVINSVM